MPYIGYTEPGKIVAIADQAYEVDGEFITIPTQYLPERVYSAYLQLNGAMKADLGKELQVLYGHRSPARQIFMFFDILEQVYDFDFNKTIQRVCLPDYSEHVCVRRQAIDFKAAEGAPIDGFDQKEEYAWLKANAATFGFYESYPQHNKLGMMYEPWHWRYEVIDAQS